MSAHLEADLRCDRWRQGFDPSLDAAAEIDATKRGIAGVVDGALRQAEQNHGAVAQKAGDDPAAGHDLPVNQGMEVLQDIQYRIQPKGLAERSEPGQVDEDDRRILMDRLEQKIRILGQPLAKRRRLKLLQQIALPGEILRLAPVQPKLAGPEQNHGRSGGCNRKRGAQPDAV